MNLQPLFEMQRILDDKIIKEKGLEGVNLLDKKILALQVELGELANEWRGFKFWSENQEPRREVKCHACNGKGFHDFINSYTTEHFTEECGYCDATGIQEKDPLLEEYVDCLHFILSIGNDINVEGIMPREIYRTDIVFVINEMFEVIAKLRNIHVRKNEYQWLINEFINLGEMLGFTWEQIETAYYDKNKVNHERQVNGY